MSNTILSVGDIESKNPSEHGIRRMNRKTLAALHDLEQEEYLMLVGTVGAQKRVSNSDESTKAKINIFNINLSSFFFYFFSLS